MCCTVLQAHGGFAFRGILMSRLISIFSNKCYIGETWKSHQGAFCSYVVPNPDFLQTFAHRSCKTHLIPDISCVLANISLTKRSFHNGHMERAGLHCAQL